MDGWEATIDVRLYAAGHNKHNRELKAVASILGGEGGDRPSNKKYRGESVFSSLNVSAFL